MAVIIFNINHSPSYIAKNESDLKIHRGDLEIIKADGRLKTISDADYDSYLCGEKSARLDGDNVVFEDVLNVDDPNHEVTSEEFDYAIDSYLTMVTNTLENNDHLRKEEHANLKTRLEDFKSALENIDKSALSFPLSSSFRRWWTDNQSSEIFDTRFIS